MLSAAAVFRTKGFQAFCRGRVSKPFRSFLLSRLVSATEFSKVLSLVDAHSLDSKIRHSAFVVAASEREALNYSRTIAFARFPGLLLYDNSTKHERAGKATVNAPVMAAGAAYGKTNYRLNSSVMT
jgi:hypothetical protein